MSAFTHCNHCFELFSPKLRFFILSPCKHIFCAKCMHKSERGTICPFDKQKITKHLEINKSMPQNVKDLLNPRQPAALHASFQSSMEFLMQQNMNLIRNRLDMETKYKRACELNVSLARKVEEHKKVYQRTRELRRKKQVKLRGPKPEDQSVDCAETSAASDPFKTPASQCLVPFASQKASTPTEASQNKVLFSGFSFRSNDSFRQ